MYKLKEDIDKHSHNFIRVLLKKYNQTEYGIVQINAK